MRVHHVSSIRLVHVLRCRNSKKPSTARVVLIAMSQAAAKALSIQVFMFIVFRLIEKDVLSRWMHAISWRELCQNFVIIS